MKIVLLLGHSGEKKLELCKERIQTVFEELDIEVDSVDLHGLPYYKESQVSPIAALIAEKIETSKGVIALTSVHVGGMHSSMQSFFEHFTRYTHILKDKPLLAITATEFQGERQAAYQILQSWSTLGGTDAGASYMNSYSDTEVVLEHIEKQLEGYYRLVRQGRVGIACSEYYMYKDTLHLGKVKSIEKVEGLEQSISGIKEDEDAPLHIDLSTKEQNIQELTQLLKHQISDEASHEFVEAPRMTYNRPLTKNTESSHKGSLKISSIPHYFIAQHDKQFQASIQYTITDTNEEGTIIIADGDCTYIEHIDDVPTVEIILTQDILLQVIKKQLSYQKAFMIGKLKVKGNFGILAKLDQIFKAS